MGGGRAKEKEKANAEFAEVRGGQREEKPTKSLRECSSFAATI